MNAINNNKNTIHKTCPSMINVLLQSITSNDITPPPPSHPHTHIHTRKKSGKACPSITKYNYVQGILFSLSIFILIFKTVLLNFLLYFVEKLTLAQVQLSDLDGSHLPLMLKNWVVIMLTLYQFKLSLPNQKKTKKNKQQKTTTKKQQKTTTKNNNNQFWPLTFCLTFLRSYFILQTIPGR